MQKDITLPQISKLLDEKLTPIQKTLNEHGRILNEHGKMLIEHGKILREHSMALGTHGTMLRSLKKDQNTMLDMLDGAQMDQRKRIKRVEERLEINSPVSY